MIILFFLLIIFLKASTKLLTENNCIIYDLNGAGGNTYSDAMKKDQKEIHQNIKQSSSCPVR